MSPEAPLYVNNGRFRADYFNPQRDRFESLARDGQQPQLLCIACADSRVTPEYITSAAPGQIFVARNIANLIPPPDSASASVGAVVEFGVQHLRIPHIAVCAHTDCTGVRTIAAGLTKLPATSPLFTWLARAGWAPDRPGDVAPDTLSLLVRRNVLRQIEHLKMYPFVREAVAAGRLRLHAWLYNLETGELSEYSAAEGDFVPL